MRILLLIFSLMAFQAYCALNPPQTFSSTNGNLIISATSTTNGGLVQSNFDFSIEPALINTNWVTTNDSRVLYFANSSNYFNGNFNGIFSGTGPWVETNNGTSFNQTLYTPTFYSKTTNVVISGGITISGSTNSYVNGTYTIVSSVTNVLGQVGNTWNNTSSLDTTNVYYEIKTIKMSGGSSYSDGTYLQWGWSPVPDRIYSFGGTNYLIHGRYNILGSSLAIFFDPRYGWICQNGGVVLKNDLNWWWYYNSIANPFDPAWSTNWVALNFPAIPPNGNQTASAIPFLSGPNTNGVTVQYSITSDPTTGNMVLSGEGATYTKDSASNDPNGHWTQIIGTGDSAVLGSASASDVVSYVPNEIDLNAVRMNALVLNGVIYTNISQLIDQAIQIVSVFGSNVVYGGGTNTGLTVTNWTFINNYSPQVPSLGVTYTNYNLAGLLRLTMTLEYTNQPANNSVIADVFYASGTNTFQEQYAITSSNYLYHEFTISIPLNPGSTFKISRDGASTGSVGVSTASYIELPH